MTQKKYFFILFSFIFFQSYSYDLFSSLYAILHNPLSISFISQGCGFFADNSISRFAIPLFIKKYNIALDEIEKKTFCSLNDFFTRTLKPGSRPIKNHIVSPADGIITVYQNIQPTTSLLVKNQRFDLQSFLGPSINASAFYGGTVAIIYLAPHNYHRYHAPFDCTPLKAVRIPGRYESVSYLAYTNGIDPLVENERQLIVLDSNTLMVTVGALCVGRITQTYTPNISLKKGQEMGYFSFGGSTVVLVFKPNTVRFDATLTQNSTPILMGQTIAKYTNFESKNE